MNKIDFLIKLNNNYQLDKNSICYNHLHKISNKKNGILHKNYKYFCNENLCQKIDGYKNENTKINIINKINNIINYVNNITYNNQKIGGNPADLDTAILINKQGLVDSNYFPPRRILFMIIYKNIPYYLKCSAEKYSNQILQISKQPEEKRKESLSKLKIDSNILGSYLYEAKIYELVNNSLNKTKFINNSINVIDYGIFNQNDSEFNINLYDEKVNISSQISKKTVFNKKCQIKNSDISPIKYKDYFKSKIINKAKNISDYLFEFYKIEHNFSKDIPITYLLTECHTGYMTLRELITTKYNIELVTKVVYKIIDVLTFLKHDIGFSHNDLHLDNVLCDVNGNIKLFDFDLSECSNTNSHFWEDYWDFRYSKMEKIINDPQFQSILEKYPNICQKKLTNKLELSNCYDLYRLSIESFKAYNVKLPLLLLNDIKINTILNITNKHDIQAYLNTVDCESFCLKIIYGWLIFGHIDKISINNSSDIKNKDYTHIDLNNYSLTPDLNVSPINLDELLPHLDPAQLLYSPDKSINKSPQKVVKKKITKKKLKLKTHPFISCNKKKNYPVCQWHNSSDKGN